MINLKKISAGLLCSLMLLEGGSNLKAPIPRLLSPSNGIENFFNNKSQWYVFGDRLIYPRHSCFPNSFWGLFAEQTREQVLETYKPFGSANESYKNIHQIYSKYKSDEYWEKTDIKFSRAFETASQSYSKCLEEVYQKFSDNAGIEKLQSLDTSIKKNLVEIKEELNDNMKHADNAFQAKGFCDMAIEKLTTMHSEFISYYDEEYKVLNNKITTTKTDHEAWKISRTLVFYDKMKANFLAINTKLIADITIINKHISEVFSDLNTMSVARQNRATTFTDLVKNHNKTIEKAVLTGAKVGAGAVIFGLITLVGIYKYLFSKTKMKAKTKKLPHTHADESEDKKTSSHSCNGDA